MKLKELLSQVHRLRCADIYTVQNVLHKLAETASGGRSAEWRDDDKLKAFCDEFAIAVRVITNLAADSDECSDVLIVTVEGDPAFLYTMYGEKNGYRITRLTDAEWVDGFTREVIKFFCDSYEVVPAADLEQDVGQLIGAGGYAAPAVVAGQLMGFYIRNPTWTLAPQGGAFAVSPDGVAFVSEAPPSKPRDYKDNVKAYADGTEPWQVVFALFADAAPTAGEWKAYYDASIARENEHRRRDKLRRDSTDQVNSLRRKYREAGPGEEVSEEFPCEESAELELAMLRRVFSQQPFCGVNEHEGSTCRREGRVLFAKRGTYDINKK